MSALRFRRLRVHRMPGIRDGGYTLEMGPGLNVVHGPNASGKTTTARAMEALLWPRDAAPERAWATAELELGGERWTVELDTGHVRYQKNGTDAAAPSLPPADQRDRYRLSLHELLRADDAGFAAAVARESAGGYDLAAAARALEPRTTASRCTREVEALKHARTHLAEARSRQEALHGEERRLRELQREAATREGLRARLRLLERAAEHAEARREAEAARRALAAFPAGMARLRGDEAERLSALRDRLRGVREEAREAARERTRAEEALASAALPGGGLPDALLPTLRARLQSLQEAERTVREQERVLREAEGVRDREGQRLAGVEVGRLARLDSGAVEAAVGLARAAETLRAEREAAEATLRWLAGEVPEGREALDRGAWLLQRWLRSGSGAGEREARLRRLATGAAALLLLGGTLGGLSSPGLFALALAGAAVLLLARRVRTPEDPRPAGQREYAELGLETPREWSEREVAALLERLQARAAVQRLEEERRTRRAEAARKVEALEDPARELEARRGELAARLGVEPATEDLLSWLTHRVARWQDAQAAADGATAALEAARGRLAREMEVVAERLRPLGYAFSGVAELSGAITDLERREREGREAAARLRSAREALDRGGAEIREREGERHALLARLRLGEEEEATVAAWCADHSRYIAASERVRVAEARREELHGRLAALPGSEASLREADPEALEAEHAAAEAALEEAETRHEEATRLATRIEEAKRGHAVEEALVEVERAEEALREARARDERAAAAAAVLTYVQQATRDQHLPHVFHRARALFSRITHGRYRLDFDDGEATAFRACDTTTGVGHPLEELSSATRVQLLLSVRLAFVEAQETGAKLPLLLDETLGNSDDRRGRALMEAVLALAAEGRQLLYLTAQPEEVARWRALAEEHPEVEVRVVDLAAARGEPRRLAIPALRVVDPAPVPAPGGADHAGYGRRLRVPALDPHAPAGASHLWYLVEDPDALHRLLGELRVERWGELHSLVEHGGGALVPPALYRRTRVLAAALETALELALVGRGRPVDRAALVDSGVVSDTFLDAVDELCGRHRGDARLLLEALEAGEVKRFQSRVRESLQEYLEAEGYLDSSSPLEPHRVRARTLAVVAAEIEEGTLSISEVDRLLERVAAALSTPVPG